MPVPSRRLTGVEALPVGVKVLYRLPSEDVSHTAGLVVRGGDDDDDDDDDDECM